MAVYITRRAPRTRRGVCRAGDRVFARSRGGGMHAEVADLREATRYESIADATRHLPPSALHDGWAPIEHSDGGRP